MLKLVVVLSVAVVAASAVSKDDVQERLSVQADYAAVYSLASSILNSRLQETAQVIASLFPASADCVNEQMSEPMSEITQALNQTASEFAQEFETIEQAFEAAVSDEDLEAVSDKLSELESRPAPDVVIEEIVAPIAQNLQNEMKNTCNCEENGNWCKAFD